MPTTWVPIEQNAKSDDKTAALCIVTRSTPALAFAAYTTSVHTWVPYIKMDMANATGNPIVRRSTLGKRDALVNYRYCFVIERSGIARVNFFFFSTIVSFLSVGGSQLAIHARPIRRGGSLVERSVGWYIAFHRRDRFGESFRRR